VVLGVEAQLWPFQEVPVGQVEQALAVVWKKPTEQVQPTPLK